MSDTRDKLIAVIDHTMEGGSIGDIANAIIEAFPGLGLEPLDVEVATVVVKTMDIGAWSLNTEQSRRVAKAIVARFGTEPKPALSEDEGPPDDVVETAMLELAVWDTPDPLSAATALAAAGLLRGQVPPEYVQLVEVVKAARVFGTNVRETRVAAYDWAAIQDWLAAIEQREVQA